MSNKLYKNIFIVVLGFSFFNLVSCKKALDLKSTHYATEELQWKTLSDTRSSLMGVYGLFRAALVNNNAHWLWSELRKGDFNAYRRSDLEAITKGNLNASFPLMKDLTNWRRFYAVINSASILIERAPEVMANDPKYTESNLKLDIAQARALRAFAYFYMVRIWGDVPLITSSHDNGSFVEKPRTDKGIVLSYAERELLAAAQDLPYLYGVSPTAYYGEYETRWNGVLLTKNSAYAILAHIAAWQGRYIDVDVYSEFVMNNYAKSKINYLTIGQLTQATGFFSGKNAAQVVAFSAVDDFNESSAGGHIEQLTLAAPLVLKQYPELFVPKDSIPKIFNDPQNKDVRFGLDTLSGLYKTNYFINYSGTTPIFSKIKVIRGGTTDGDYAVFGSALVFTRLEDIVLLRAEAFAVLGRRDEAIRLLNIVRNSRSLSSYNDDAKEDLVDEIFAERRRELMGEGHRWYDQVRYHKIKRTNSEFNKLIAEEGIYWPISEDVRSNNSRIVQNSYWK